MYWIITVGTVIVTLQFSWCLVQLLMMPSGIMYYLYIIYFFSHFQFCCSYGIIQFSERCSFDLKWYLSVSKWWKARRVDKEAKIIRLFWNYICLCVLVLHLSSMQICVITPLHWQLGHINQAASITASFYLQLHIVVQRNSTYFWSVRIQLGLAKFCFAIQKEIN